MIKNIQKRLEKKLSSFVGKSIIITQNGFLKNKFFIIKLKFNIEYEILTITDKESKAYLSINLNQIYHIRETNRQTKLYLDNDTEITLECK